MNHRDHSPLKMCSTFKVVFSRPCFGNQRSRFMTFRLRFFTGMALCRSKLSALHFLVTRETAHKFRCNSTCVNCFSASPRPDYFVADQSPLRYWPTHNPARDTVGIDGRSCICLIPNGEQFERSLNLLDNSESRVNEARRDQKDG